MRSTSLVLVFSPSGVTKPSSLVSSESAPVPNQISSLLGPAHAGVGVRPTTKPTDTADTAKVADIRTLRRIGRMVFLVRPTVYHGSARAITRRAAGLSQSSTRMSPSGLRAMSGTRHSGVG